MTDWQPIATAPKDGTVILGVRFDTHGDGEAYPEGATMQYEGGPSRVLQGAWAYTGLMVSLVSERYLPTHWLPLPPPPVPVTPLMTGSSLHL